MQAKKLLAACGCRQGWAQHGACSYLQPAALCSHRPALEKQPTANPGGLRRALSQKTALIKTKRAMLSGSPEPSAHTEQQRAVPRGRDGSHRARCSHRVHCPPGGQQPHGLGSPGHRSSSGTAISLGSTGDVRAGRQRSALLLSPRSWLRSIPTAAGDSSELPAAHSPATPRAPALPLSWL